MTVWYEGTLIQKETIAHNVARFWVKMPNETRLFFKAGQFVTMDLPIHEKRSGRWRSYSIANAPNILGNDILEFCISKKEGGLASTYFFETIQIGENIKFKGADGGFYLPETVEKDLVFICTGTGIAPFRSMIAQIFEQQLPHKNLHLIFGTRTEDGILYPKEWERYKQNSSFKFDIALSRAEKSSPPSISTGYVHQIYEKAYSNVRPDVLFYICGWSNMIDDAVAKLLEMGYDRSQIKFELYG